MIMGYIVNCVPGIRAINGVKFGILALAGAPVGVGVVDEGGVVIGDQARGVFPLVKGGVDGCVDVI